MLGTPRDELDHWYQLTNAQKVVYEQYHQVLNDTADVLKPYQLDIAGRMEKDIPDWVHHILLMKQNALSGFVAGPKTLGTVPSPARQRKFPSVLQGLFQGNDYTTDPITNLHATVSSLLEYIGDAQLAQALAKRTPSLTDMQSQDKARKALLGWVQGDNPAANKLSANRIAALHPFWQGYAHEAANQINVAGKISDTLLQDIRSASARLSEQVRASRSLLDGKKHLPGETLPSGKKQLS